MGKERFTQSHGRDIGLDDIAMLLQVIVEVAGLVGNTGTVLVLGVHVDWVEETSGEDVGIVTLNPGCGLIYTWD
jgi:hypothetical protein